MGRRRILSFGLENEEPYRLEIIERLAGEDKEFTLSLGGTIISEATPKALELLSILILQSPRQKFTTNELIKRLSHDCENNLIARYISTLRSALDSGQKNARGRTKKRSSGAKASPFIGTVPGGYLLNKEVNVTEEEDQEFMEAFPRWSPDHFNNLLRGIKRDEDHSTEDLRIVTTGFSPSLEVIDIQGLLDRKIRIKILFLNPWNEQLTNLRYGLRRDKDPARCVRELKQQIHDIRPIAEDYQPVKRKETENAADKKTLRGSLEFGLSDLMPCNMVVHTKRWVLTGTFMIDSSYATGPMTEIHRDDSAWERYLSDWKVRWHHAMGQNMTTLNGTIPAKPWSSEKSGSARSAPAVRPSSSLD